MAKELAFVLINPYTIAKSRTGGVIARVISRTDAKLVGARMFGPSQELVEDLGGGDAQSQERAVDVQITRLRRKIEDDPKAPRYLQTVRGSGYMLAPD